MSEARRAWAITRRQHEIPAARVEHDLERLLRGADLHGAEVSLSVHHPCAVVPSEVDVEASQVMVLVMALVMAVAVVTVHLLDGILDGLLDGLLVQLHRRR